MSDITLQGYEVIHPERSFWWKISRAEKHLEELKGVIAAYSARGPYVAIRDSKAEPKRRRSDPPRYYYRAKLAKQPGPDVAVIIGDVSHNLRAALDHVAVSLAPASRKRKASFPIYVQDIWQCDASGKPLQRFEKERRTFESRVKGMPQQAVDMIRDCQPCNNPHPTRNLLTLLSAIENADKHVQLSTITTGLIDFEIRFRPDGGTRVFRGEHASPVVEDGAVVAIIQPETLPADAPPVDEAKMQVEIEGSAQISVKLPGYTGHFEVVPLFGDALRIVGSIASAFEPLIP